jgi:glycosyltransferase involved in cell wall biosynthesis
MNTPHKILLVDTGREWGGGTNSMIELLKRADRQRFHFVCVFYHNYRRGAASDLRTELAKLGIDSIFLTPRRQPLWAKLAKELGRGVLFFSREAKRMAVFWVDYLWRTRTASHELAALATKQGARLIYLNNQPSTNLAGILAGVRTGIPVLQHARIEGTLNSVERILANRGLARMICVSAGVRAAFVGAGLRADKCVVVHNGISAQAQASVPADDIRRRHGIQETDLVIGTVGSLIKRKAVDHLIEAIARLKRPDVKCLIVGEGPEREHLTSLATARGISSQCIFAGFQQDPLSYTNAMDIFVLASAQEGLPRVVLEAMLLGKPVAASRVAGSAEVVIDGTTGLLFRYGDVAGLTEHLQTLVGRPELRKTLGQNGRQRVLEHFSIERYVQGVERELDTVLAQCHTSS